MNINALRCVIPLGLEPKTHSLEGCCSIQLSYGTILYRGCKVSQFLSICNYLGLVESRS